jgi:hypothetical protein
VFSCVGDLGLNEHVRFRIFVKIACGIIGKSRKSFAKMFAKIQKDLQMLALDSFNTKRHKLPAKCDIKGPFCKNILMTWNFVIFSRKYLLLRKLSRKNVFFQKFSRKYVYDMRICSRPLQKISCF